MKSVTKVLGIILILNAYVSGSDFLNKSNSNLTSIEIEELKTFDNWTKIDLSHNSINSIESFELLLRKQKKLETLLLDFNRNFNVKGNEPIFAHETLKWISWKGCGFTKIQKFHFSTLTAIESLDMSENAIDSIDSDAFESNSKLRHLDLAANKLTSIPHSIFSKLMNFEELRLSRNAIGLPKSKFFLKSYSLKRLTLDNCRLTEIYRETFSELRAMEKLNLNDNSIQTLSVEVFKINTKLKTLLIERNNLKYFLVSILDNFPHLELCVDNNKFVNNQEFKNFQKRYERKINCTSDAQFYVENLFKDETTTTSTEKSLKLPNVNTEGISDFFLGSYLSIILIVQAASLVLLSLYYIKVTKYEKLGSGSDDDVNYANTILNDNDIYKVYRLDE